MMVLSEEDGHSCIEFAHCELHFRRAFGGHLRDEEGDDGGDVSR